MVMNARGLNAPKNKHKILKLVEGKEVDIYDLLETKICPSRQTPTRHFFSGKWGGVSNSRASEAFQGDSIWVIWNKNLWHVDILVIKRQFIPTRFMDLGGLQIVITFI